MDGKWRPMDGKCCPATRIPSGMPDPTDASGANLGLIPGSAQNISVLGCPPRLVPARQAPVKVIDRIRLPLGTVG